MKRSLFIAALLVLASGIAARADSRIEKSLKLDPKGQFTLDSDVGSVNVTGSAEAGARVVITSERDDLEKLFTFGFEENPGTVRVTARKKYGFGWPHHLNLHFEIRVPTETRGSVRTGGGGIEVSSLRGDTNLETSGGGIEVSGLTGRLDAHTSGGHIELREVTGNARIETSGGGIEVSGLDGSLSAHTSGGPIRIDGVTGRVDAHTSGGSVTATFSRGNTRGGTLETSGGSIHVAIDTKSNLNLEASTSGGSVTTNLPITVQGRISSSSLSGKIGSGGELLRLQTSGGSIHIEAR